MTFRRFGRFLILLLAVMPASGLGSDTAALDDLAWLAGDWRRASADSFAQEIWLAPRGGSLPGVFRLYNDGRLVVHEYILITQEDDGVVLRFKHFNADYSTWEPDAPLTFRLAEVREGYALFENAAPAPGAPDLLRYEVSGDTLTATVMDDPDNPDAGEPMVFEFQRHSP